MILYFVGGEMIFYLVFKLTRGDFYWFSRVEGFFAVIMAFFQRFFVKIIVDFTGCLHFRHPYELGKWRERKALRVTLRAQALRSEATNT